MVCAESFVCGLCLLTTLVLLLPSVQRRFLTVCRRGPFVQLRVYVSPRLRCTPGTAPRPLSQATHPCETNIFCECMHRRCYSKKLELTAVLWCCIFDVLSCVRLSTVVGMCAWRYLAFQPIPGAAAWAMSTPDSHCFLSCVMRA